MATETWARRHQAHAQRLLSCVNQPCQEPSHANARCALNARYVCRVDSQDWHNRAVGRIDPNWSSEDAVTAEMKRQNKGQFLQKQSAHYNAARTIVEGRTDYHTLSTRQKGMAKTAACKLLSAAFIACIGTGKIFDMLGKAGRDDKINNDLWNRAQNIYDK